MIIGMTCREDFRPYKVLGLIPLVGRRRDLYIGKLSVSERPEARE
jgi:hypothetical protein